MVQLFNMHAPDEVDTARLFRKQQQVGGSDPAAWAALASTAGADAASDSEAEDAAAMDAAAGVAGPMPELEEEDVLARQEREWTTW